MWWEKIKNISFFTFITYWFSLTFWIIFLIPSLIIEQTRRRVKWMRITQPRLLKTFHVKGSWISWMYFNTDQKTLANILRSKGSSQCSHRPVLLIKTLVDYSNIFIHYHHPFKLNMMIKAMKNFKAQRNGQNFWQPPKKLSKSRHTPFSTLCSDNALPAPRYCHCCLIAVSWLQLE